MSFNSQKYVVVVQLQSPVQLFVTPWTSAWQALLSFTISLSLLTRMSIESVMPSNHLILCHPLLLCLQSFPASEFFQMSQLFSSGGQSIGVSVSTSVLPMNSSGWWWLISSVFLTRTSCHKTTHANSYYGAWPGWAVSVSVLRLTLPF